MNKGLSSTLLAILLLSGCSHEVSLTYNCLPSGAMVYEQGVGEVGACPVIVRYNTDDVKISDGMIHTDKIRVLWASGASLMIEPMVVKISDERQASLTFVRPEDYPYYQRDLNFSMAFEERLPVPQIKYIVTAEQDRDLFDTLNTTASCAFSGITLSVTAQCP